MLKRRGIPNSPHTPHPTPHTPHPTPHTLHPTPHTHLLATDN
ncbi:hypothetical protein [Chroococcidiopsis sp.]